MPVPGKIKSKKQQGFLFANYPKAAHKWAHGKSSSKSDWRKSSSSRRRNRKKRK